MAKSKLEKAVALRFNKEKDNAPKVIASGKGIIAEQIIERAEEHDVPLYKDPSLVEALLPFKLGAEIPPELYQAVAEVLAFVYRLDKEP